MFNSWTVCWREYQAAREISLQLVAEEMRFGVGAAIRAGALALELKKDNMEERNAQET